MFSFQYGLMLEYSITKSLSIIYDAITWYGSIDELEKNGQALTLSDIRLDTNENLKIRLDETTMLIGLRFYF